MLYLGLTATADADGEGIGEDAGRRGVRADPARREAKH